METISKCVDSDGDSFMLLLKSESLQTDKDKRDAVEVIRDYANQKHFKFVSEMEKLSKVTGLNMEINSIIKIL